MYRDYIGLGIAGNVAKHLEQAGEIADFKDILTEDPYAPKGMFSFYIPHFDTFLGIYPISSTLQKLPDYECNVQIEPEVALICDVEYSGDEISKITPTHFGAYNDCSLRKEASKISHKKNWGDSSKGLSDTLIKIDKFESGGIMDSYRIASFLRRDGIVMRYGEDTPLLGYSYFHTKLIDWIKNTLNTQIDIGPLENLKEYIKKAKHPKKAIISIGATRYTTFGESNFLRDGDEIIVVLYDTRLYCTNPILSMVSSDTVDNKDGVSVLRQKVVRG